MLYQTYPNATEGELSKKKAILVSEPVLSSIARKLELGNYLLLGKGELASNGKDRDSNLANLMEAILGAMYLDKGLEKTKAWLLPHLMTMLAQIPKYQTSKDAKTLLQEFTQKKYKKVPSYKILEEKGLEHKKEFIVEVSIENMKAVGVGQSKKAAETNAAMKLLEIIQEK